MKEIRQFIGGVLISTLALFSTTAWAQTYKNPYIEAECPDTSSGAYGTFQTDHSGYSGKGHLRSSGNTTAGNFNNSSSDRATYNFRVFGKAFYRVYFRVNTNGSGGDDSWFFNLDGYEWVTVNNVSGQGSGWIWVAAPSSYLLSAGTHSLQLANREDGLNIDKIAILEESDPAPTGTGEPGYNCAVPFQFEAECRETATSGYGVRHIAKVGFSGTGYLQSESNSSSASSSADTVSYTFETAAASYSFYFRAHTNGSYNDDSLYYRVDGGSWQTLNGLASQGNGWIWAAGTSSLTLAKGLHTLEVANREDGLSLDKIAFVPSGSSAPAGQGTAGVNCYGDSDDFRISDVYEYAYGHTDYFFSEGNFILNRHMEWHMRPNPENPRFPVNGSGGNTGPGSGVAFLGFHRAMLNRFEQYALSNGGRKWEAIAVDAVLPYELPDASSALFAADMMSEYLPRVNTDLTTIGERAYLKLDGSPDPNWFINTETLGENTYTKLGDIESLDALGRVIGGDGLSAIRWGHYHGTVHNALGGTMGTHASPADPAFYLWHGKIDQIVDLWLTTPAGQAWIAANPDHPFLEPGFTELEGWETDFWATQVQP